MTDLQPYLEVVAAEPPVGSVVNVRVQLLARHIGRRHPDVFSWPQRTRTEAGWVRSAGDPTPVAWEDLVGRLVHEAGRLRGVSVEVTTAGITPADLTLAC